MEFIPSINFWIGLILFLCSLAIGLGLLVQYLSKKLKLLELGHGSYYHFDKDKKFDELLYTISNLDVAQKEIIINRLYGRPVIISKIVDGSRAWFAGTAPFIPDESELHPQYVDELLKKMTG